MSSDSPSGGMKEIVLSLSKRDRRTHWWNFTSSIATVLPLSPECNMKTSVNMTRRKLLDMLGSERWTRLKGGFERTSSEGKQHAVIEAEPQFGHPREHRFQLDAAHDVAAHYTAVGIHLKPSNTATQSFVCLFKLTILKECQINSTHFLCLSCSAASNHRYEYCYHHLVT